MPETSTVYRQLQLQVLQWIGMSMMVMLPLARFLLLADTGLSMPVRTACFAYSAYVAVAVDERTVRFHGAAVTLLLYLVSMLRFTATDDEQVVLLMVVYGTYRVLPFLAALFGVVGLSIATGVLSAASPLVVVLSKRVLLGKITLEQATTAPQAVLTDQELLIIIGEVYYLAIATAIAITFERALNRALTLLADALAAKQQFITTMNHEIRTPLVGVVSMTDLLLVEGGLPRHLIENLRIIQDSGRALLAIVNNILDISKLNAHKTSADTSEVHIQTALIETVNMFTARASAKGLDYRVTVDASVPATVRTDARRLQQILGNLLGNAFKFTHTGSVAVSIGYVAQGVDEPSDMLALPRNDPGTAWSVFHACGRHAEDDRARRRRATTWLPSVQQRFLHTVTAQARRLFAHHAPRRAALWIRVADTGVGMRADQLELVVQPFQQADASITRKYGGSGLGLAICTELVTLLGGDFVFSSALDHGSIFAVIIPCDTAIATAAAPATLVPGAAAAPPAVTRIVHAAAAAPDPATAPTPVPPPTRPASSSRTSARTVRRGRPVVLVADDNPINVQVAVRQLARCGCDAVVVPDGQMCVDYVRRHLGVGPALATAAVHGSSGVLPPPTERLDAILMDLHMPILDGASATRHIRTLEAGAGSPRLPIIGLTADDPNEVGELCRDAGMDRLLRKPLVLHELHELHLDDLGLSRRGPN